MPRLVQKSGYIKNGKAGGYMKYIATREGVEKISGSGAATAKQKETIAQLLKDYPDTKELFEYEDYIDAPTIQSASELISTAIDLNVQDIQPSDIYMKYIATRPNVELRGSHGLFGESDHISLPDTLSELEKHKGNVWTLIYSLRREDAATLGYDNAENWRQLILSHSQELSDAMRIPADQFHWYAAFHDAGHHPHIHMMVWSGDEKRKGFLNQDGIAKMRSVLTNDIFEEELHEIFIRKDVAYKELTETVQEAMEHLIAQMQNSICDNPIIEQKTMELATQLGSVNGKKQYGYLKKPLKQLVDELVDELGKEPEVAECFETWQKIHDELTGFYNNKSERLPLSRQKEFKKIKNMIIAEAEHIRLGDFSFEDAKMDDEPDPSEPETPKDNSEYRKSIRYSRAKRILCDHDTTQAEKQSAIAALENLWSDGYVAAAHLLGKVYRDGIEVPQDGDFAKEWFLRSANAGNTYSQYALGKLLEKEAPKESLKRFEKAAENGNQFAQYRLAKLLLTGDRVEKDINRAAELFRASAKQGNQYAQYTLGKMYLQGVGAPKDKEEAKSWFEKSAAQGNQYADYFLSRIDSDRNPAIFLSATKFLHHLSRIFQNHSQPPTNPNGPRIDSKRRKRLQEKRIALGHKENDHEDYINYQQSM